MLNRTCTKTLLLAVVVACDGLPAECEPECSAGYACSAGLCVLAEQACVPSCSLGYTCELGACVSSASGDTQPAPSPAAPGNPSQPLPPEPAIYDELVDLGTVSAASPFEVEVPSGLVSFQIDAISSSMELAMVTRAVGPRGERVVDPDNRSESDRRVFPLAGIASIRFPFAPNEALEPGRWSFVIESLDATATFRVTARWRRALRTTLDINLILVGLRNVNAGNALQNARFAGMVDTYRQIYAAAGIRVAEVRLIDASAEDAEKFGVIDSQAEINEAFWLPSRYSSNAHLNFLLVRSIAIEDAAGVILGIAGGIPGLASVTNSPQRGVLVSTDWFETDPWTVAVTMAHEGGHYLGLRHPSERNGAMHDLLGDTPECDRSHDSDGDGLVVVAECFGFGADNLMFWSADSREPPRITPNQVEMLSRGSSLR
ncbi:MAG: hypothetical protein HYV07_19850 [Deltaproteobacteria bacterium]|nr:hypothetical protein [Deltaproteobacteria bacterium]